MANFSLASFTNTSNITDREANVPLVAGSIILIIINTITFPCTVILNVFVIKAVKTTPRLRNNSNILLACLAVTDAFTGLLCQPLIILWTIILLLGHSISQTVTDFWFTFVAVMLTASFFHVMLVTFERLIAIKFTMQYSNIVTYNNMKIAVLSVWIFVFINGILRMTVYRVAHYLTGLSIISNILFHAFTYLTIYRETRWHQKRIETQQLPQDEVKRFVKENKALKTTVFIVGAVIVCLLPVCFCFIVKVTGLYEICPINARWMLTCAMLNSLVNPLIYCWRQKEMRKVIFGLRTRIVSVNIQWRRAM